MIFSRIIVAAISVVSVTAIPFLSLNPPPKPAPDSIARRDAVLPPLQVCSNQMRQLKTTVPDIMAGPAEQREPKFIDLTNKALKIVQDCNESVKSTSSAFKSSDDQMTDDLNTLSQVTVRTLRACKSVRNKEVANNIDLIMTQMEDIQTSVNGFFGGLLAALLEKFMIRMGKLDSIRAATAA